MFRKVNRGTFRFEFAVSFIFFLLINLNISGQGIQMSFDHLTVDDGLSQSCVFSIAQDSKGFMWFGTRDGLNKYDSHAFKEYKHNQKDPNSLIGSVIFSLLSDKQGTLWVGTNNGLSIYNSQKDNFTNLVNNPKDPNSLSQNGIMYILEDRSHHIWVGTRNGLNLLISR
ncbi:MAG: two-component regulator propeller domain-containing protein, partial [Bacteroidota bacterium]|nr:two-component regulator propeller domain-containing protein [Bacteroidota bacterium]